MEVSNLRQITTEKESDRIKQCVECYYWITSNTKYCPNCGIIDPHIKRPPKPKSDRELSRFLPEDYSCIFILHPIIAMIAGLILGGIAMGIFGGQYQTSFWSMSFLSYIVLHRIKFCDLYKSMNEWKEYDRFFFTKTKECLKYKESKLVEYINLNKEKYKKIDKLKGDMDKNNNLNRSDLSLKTLSESQNALIYLNINYEEKIFEIEFQRLANKGAFIFYNTKDNNYEKRQKYICFLEDHIKKGEELIKKWENINVSQIKSIVDRISESLKKCQSVQKEIIAQQANYLTVQITHFDKSLNEFQKFNSDEMDLFNSLANVDEFLSGFGDLEKEYYRLLGEKEVNSEIGSIL